MGSQNSPIFLLGVGGQKCGTSWLAGQLDRHPQFMMSPIKEIHYWDRRFQPEYFRPRNLEKKLTKLINRGAEQVLKSPLIEQSLMARHELYYRAFFESRLQPRHRAFGEISPSYCILSAEQFYYVRKFMQPYRTRALFIMRDPVARIWSQCKMEALKGSNRGQKLDPVAAFEAQFNEPMIMRRSNYKSTIENLDRAFDDNERHYAFFEELFQPESLKAICSFLEIDMIDFDITDNPNLGERLEKPEPEAWARVREAYGFIYDFVEERMGYLPEKWRA